MSIITMGKFAPTLGWTYGNEMTFPVGSTVSAQNMIVRDGELRVRDRWASLSTSALSYTDSANARMVVHVNSGGTATIVYGQASDRVFYLDSTLRWSRLSLTSAAGGSAGLVGEPYGASNYLPRQDVNILAFTDGVSTPFAWGGPDSAAPTEYSRLTGAPICGDLAPFDNRLMAWNVTSGSSAYVQRIQWCVAGDPEDWTGLGSGSEDLLDMKGAGTRVIEQEDRVLLGSTGEIWEGRATGEPFFFRFTPFTRFIGMGLKRAVLPTPQGLFWLHSDYMLYRLQGNSIQEVGGNISEWLRDNISDEQLNEVFLGYNGVLRQLSVYLPNLPAGGHFPARRFFSLNVDNNTWMPQVPSNNTTIVASASVAVPIGSIGGVTSYFPPT